MLESDWLLNRLSSVLVLSGVFPSYTNAVKAVQAKHVLINIQIVINQNQIIQAGDVITIKREA